MASILATFEIIDIEQYPLHVLNVTCMGNRTFTLYCPWDPYGYQLRFRKF